jgi:hypothetical protein
MLSISDWGTWPLIDQTNEIDAMVDAYHEQQDNDIPITEPKNSVLEGKEDSLYEESSALAVSMRGINGKASDKADKTTWAIRPPYQFKGLNH